MNGFNITGKVVSIVKKAYIHPDGSESPFYYEISINHIKNTHPWIYFGAEEITVCYYKELDDKIAEGKQIKVYGCLSVGWDRTFISAIEIETIESI